MNQGQAGKGQGIFLRSVLAITMAARTIRSGVVFKASKQVMVGLGEGGGWEVDGGWGWGQKDGGRGDNRILQFVRYFFN